MTESNRPPGAWRIDDTSVVSIEETSLDVLEPVSENAAEAVQTIASTRRPRRLGFARLAMAAAGGLISLAIALSLETLIRDLFARADWLGWTGLVLLAVFVAGILGVAMRELIGIFRLRHVARLRLQADEAAQANDRNAAIAVGREIAALYRHRPETARGRRLVAEHSREIIDGRDLLILLERDLLSPLDARATREITSSAKRVSVVTAVSPRAFVDVAYVLVEGLRLIRRLSELYGGRPGALGLMRLTRAVVGHLAVTGTMAIGDTILQQLVGPGLAARISARFGEGVVNGVMTARIGLSALDICRPLPFLQEKRPKLADLVGKLSHTQENDSFADH